MQNHHARRLAGTSLALMLAAAPAGASTTGPGQPDPTFGGGDGLTTISVAFHFTRGVRAITVDAEGRVLVGGQAEFQPLQQTDFIVLRFLPNGTPDPAFDSDGAQEILWGFNSFDRANGIAVQSDGRIVFSGTGDVTRFYVLGRLLEPNGQLDLSFGDDPGTAFLGYPVVGADNPTGQGTSEAMLLQPDDRIVVAGNAGPAIAVIRLEPDGEAFDATFGDGGVRFLPPVSGASFERVTDIERLPNGDFIVAADAQFPGIGPEGMLIRVGADGSPQPFGGSNGYAGVPGVSGVHVIRDIVATDTRILVTGFRGELATGGDVSAFVACLDHDGLPCNDFGTGGLVERDEDGWATYLTVIGVEPGGRIVAGGAQRPDDTFAYRPFVVGLTADGSADPSYGNGGSNRLDDVIGFTDAGTLDGAALLLTGMFDNDYGVLRLLGGDPAPAACPCDRDASGVIDFADLVQLLADWGSPAGDCTGDGTTGFEDVLDALAGWGPCTA